MPNKTLAILTGGGPTSVINASVDGLVREAREHDFRIYAFQDAWRGVVEERILDLTDVIESHLWYKPSTEFGTSRFNPTLHPEDLERVVEVLQAHGITHFAPIGGDDTMGVAAKLHELLPNLHIIGIPKTIDNDLSHTDYSPGYPSVAQFIADYVWRLRQDARAFGRIYVVEVMGRNSGFIAGAGTGARDDGSCDRADFILTPEMRIDYPQFKQQVKERREERGNLVVVVSEGITDQDGNEIKCGNKNDGFGHPQLGGAGVYIAGYLSDLGARSERIGAYQRVVKASKLDRENAELLGKECIELMLREEANCHMLTLVRREGGLLHPVYWEVGSVPLGNVTKRQLSKEDISSYNMSSEFNQYIAPFMLHGNPREDYPTIKRVYVPQKVVAGK